MHVAGGKDFIHVGFVGTGFCLYVAALVGVHAEGFGHIRLASQEACGDQNQVHRNFVFAAGHLGHDVPSRLLVKFTLKLYKLRLAHLAFFVGDKFFYRGLVDARVFAEDGDGFFLAVVGLADSRPLRPRVVRLSLIRQFRHHLQLEHALAAQADRGSDAVVSGVAAPDDHDVFILGVDIFLVGKVGVQQAFGGGGQIVHRKVNTLALSARHLDVPRVGGAAAKNDGIVFFFQLLRLDIHTHIDIGLENDALFFHDIHFSLNVDFLQLHIRDSVHQQTARTVGTLVNRHGMSAHVQIMGHRQARRAGAHHGNLLAGTHCRRFRSGKSPLIGPLDDAQLFFLDIDRITVQVAGTSHLAGSRAHPPGKFRKRVCFPQSLIRLIPVARVSRIVPFRNQIIERAAGHHAVDQNSRLTERHAAVHTSCSLYLLFFPGQRGVKFVEMSDSL